MDKTVPSSARLVVLAAYAHAVLSSILTDCALSGESIPREIGPEDQEEYGMEFEETFLQFHAPQWATGVNQEAGHAFWLEVVEAVNAMLVSR